MMLLALTLAVAVVWSGCAKQLPDCPKPTAAYDPGWCLAGTALNGKDFLWCSPSEKLCDLARESALKVSRMAGIETLSECRPATVSVVVK